MLERLNGQSRGGSKDDDAHAAATFHSRTVENMRSYLQRAISAHAFPVREWDVCRPQGEPNFAMS